VPPPRKHRHRPAGGWRGGRAKPRLWLRPPEAAGAMDGPAAVKQATVCSPRITSSGPPSPPSRSGMSASGAMPRLMAMRSADMRRAETPPPTAATHATNRPPTTPPGLRGRNSWRGWGRSFLLRARGAAATSDSSRSLPIRGRSLRRPPAGAGPLRTGGSQAGEGQDGFARVKQHLRQSRRPNAPSVSASTTRVIKR
jgi:hypothetical protein